MELKLMVRTHRENEGSVLYFSSKCINLDIEKFQGINYSKYTSNLRLMRKIERESSNIYFITYIGGQDEYGRDYQDVIATIMPYNLDEKEQGKLLALFLKIKKEVMDVEEYSLLDKRFFHTPGMVEELGRKINQSSDKAKIIMISMVFMVITIVCGLVSVYYWGKLEKYKHEVTSKYGDYIKLRRELASNISNEKKYKKLENFNYKQETLLRNLLERIEEEKYNEIIKLIKQEKYEVVSTKIENFINNIDFINKKEDVEKLLQEVQIELAKLEYEKLNRIIDGYNRNKDIKTLERIKRIAEINLKKLNGQENKRLRKILNKIKIFEYGFRENMSIYLYDKNLVFNNKSIQVEMETINSKIKKTKKMGMKQNIFIASVKVQMNTKNRYKTKVYLLNNNERILLKEFYVSFDTYWEPVLIEDDRGNSFKLSFKIDTEKFDL